MLNLASESEKSKKAKRYKQSKESQNNQTKQANKANKSKAGNQTIQTKEIKQIKANKIKLNKQKTKQINHKPSQAQAKPGQVDDLKCCFKIAKKLDMCILNVDILTNLGFCL